MVGDASDVDVASQAADAAERVAPLAGWVNNAAVFRDAWLHAEDVLPLITANLALAVTGCAVAVRRFLAHGGGGAIVNVSSHQALRPVPGALPYATAKAAVEGLTRAVAVDYGGEGRALQRGRARLDPDCALGLRSGVTRSSARLHPVGRAGEPSEVADVVALLLADGFVNGAVIPVDGGRSVLGHDPEARLP